jgi:hypothetical protein
MWLRSNYGISWSGRIAWLALRDLPGALRHHGRDQQ